MASNVRRSVIDFLCLMAVWAAVLLFDQLAKPFERGFHCNDESIRYPYREDTVSAASVGAVGIIVPILAMVVLEYIGRHDEDGLKESTAYRFRIGRIVRFLCSISHLICIFLFGAGASVLITDTAKFSIGRLRPHFIQVCSPNLSSLCSNPVAYIVDYTCEPEDLIRLSDARMSFPSGHTTFATYCAVFLAAYLHKRMNWQSGSILLRPVIQIVACLSAWAIGLSRISDYKHHWSDVMAGYVIGVVVALFTIQYAHQPVIKTEPQVETRLGEVTAI